MFGYHFVSGHTAGNSQLILGRENAILIDCSLPFCAEETIKKLKAALNGRTLDAILLSHSHYDHIAALPQIAAEFPNVPIFAHPYVIDVLSRSGAISTMEKMCNTAQKLFGEGYSCLPHRLFDIPKINPLADGDIFKFDNGKAKVIFTPGHTKDSITIDFADEGFCCLCETFGVKRPDNRIQPCFLSGYQSALESVDKITALGNRQIILSHMAEPLSGEDNDTFIARSLSSMTDSAKFICELFDQDPDEESIFERYTKVYWSEAYRHVWPFHAYEMNSRAAIKTVLKELKSSI